MKPIFYRLDCFTSYDDIFAVNSYTYISLELAIKVAKEVFSNKMTGITKIRLFQVEGDRVIRQINLCSAEDIQKKLGLWLPFL